MNILIRFWFSSLFIVITTHQNEILTTEPDQSTKVYPYPIFNITALAASPNSILLTWDFLEQHVKLVKLNVYAGVEERRVVSAWVDQQERPQYTVMGLLPGTIYTIIITSYSQSGETLVSSPLIVKTLNQTQVESHTVVSHTSSKPEREPPSGSVSRVLKWALIAGGTGLAAIIFISVVFLAMRIAKKRSDTFTIRRNCSKKSVPGQEKNTEDQYDRKLKIEEKRDEEQKEMENDVTGTEVKEKEATSNRINQPNLLKVHQMQPDYKGRSNACSGISWGSEFDVQEQEHVYSNESYQLHQQKTNALPHSRRLPSNQNNKPIFGMDTVIPIPKNKRTENNSDYGNIHFPGIYSNVQDQDALYINSEELNSPSDLSPPPIPRR